MRIRKLKLEDAKYMLEWMHDESVTKYLKKNFASLTIKDCELFILNSLKAFDELKNNKSECISLNFAIASDNDEYQGSVSLKYVDFTNKRAEFAITTRSQSHGKGYSKFAMNWIMKYAFTHLNLNTVNWNCTTDNSRAFKFYLKNFGKVVDFYIDDSKKYDKALVQYSLNKNDFFRNR